MPALLFAWLALPTLLFAPPSPTWWVQRGATIGTPDDYAAANLGQLKHFAAKAADELNAKLPGGAGSAVNNLIASWLQPPALNVTRDGFAAVNLGQLKFVAKLFYDRLIAVTYPIQYPWVGSLTPPEDSAVANLGQIKKVFSFDVGLDADMDNLPDFWELYYFTSTTDPKGGPSDDYDGDGVNNLAELVNRTSPADFFDGIPPTLEIVGSAFQIGERGTVLGQSLDVRVLWTGTTHGIINAPVRFAIGVSQPAGLTISPSLTSPVWQGTPQVVGASATAIASIFVKMPTSGFAGISTVIATVGSGAVDQTIPFTIATIRVFSSTKNLRLISSTPTPVSGQQSDRNYLELSNFSVEDVRWGYNAPVSVTVARSSDHNEICIPAAVDPMDSESRFRWLHQADGNVALRMDFGPNPGLSKTETVSLASYTTLTHQYGSYVTGSAARHCTEQIDSHIAGRSGSASDKDLYTTIDHTSTPGHENGTYIRNINPLNLQDPAKCWAAGIDLTCVPVAFQSLGGTTWEAGPFGVLVTPRVLLGTDHQKPHPGGKYRFVTMDNQVIERTVSIVRAPVFGDLAYHVLDVDLPATIKPAKVLGSVAHFGVDDPAFTDPILTGSNPNYFGP